MDRFKFRAYVKSIKILREVSELRFNEKYPVRINIIDSDIDNGVSINYTFDEVELIQSTGLKDDSGNLIFEGDILAKDKGYDYSASELTIVVRKVDGWCLKEIDGDWFHNLDYAEDFVLIGNIYENADLLEDNGGNSNE